MVRSSGLSPLTLQITVDFPNYLKFEKADTLTIHESTRTKNTKFMNKQQMENTDYYVCEIPSELSRTFWDSEAEVGLDNFQYEKILEPS